VELAKSWMILAPGPTAVVAESADGHETLYALDPAHADLANLGIAIPRPEGKLS
jgi:hypothetical protein